MALLLYCGLLLLTTASAVSSYSTEDIRNCGPNYQTIVHPGGGFDNLRNEDMESVFEISYSKCQTTPDGKYLLPDNVFAIPLHQSSSMKNSEIFYHWDNYTDLTAASINADTSFTPINGKFSEGYMEMKQHQISKITKSTRAQVRHTFYTIKLETVAKLHRNFKSAVESIGRKIEDNKAEDAAYLAQLLVRDYGTHYTTSVKAGAVLAKIDHLSSSFFHKNSHIIHSILASAGFLFFGNNTSLGAQVNKFQLDEYKERIKHTQTVAHGGLLISTTDFAIADWERGVPNALVAVDKTGIPLHYALNPLNSDYTTISNSTVPKVNELIKNAIIQYYNANTFRGCTDSDSPNFDYQANLEDKDACSASATLHRPIPSFGGAYTYCNDKSNCPFEQQFNPLTGDYTCPPSYSSIYLHYTAYNNGNKLYYIVWCAWRDKSKPPEVGLMFGGFYTTNMDNPLTGHRYCPDFYYGFKFLHNTITLCLSTDYEKGRKYAVDFGGFLKCNSGNPLAAESSTPDIWPHKCPHGTRQHSMITYDNCLFSSCIAESDVMKHKSLTPIKRPPFNEQSDYLTDGTCHREGTDCN